MNTEGREVPSSPIQAITCATAHAPTRPQRATTAARGCRRFIERSTLSKGKGKSACEQMRNADELVSGQRNSPSPLDVRSQVPMEMYRGHVENRWSLADTNEQPRHASGRRPAPPTGSRRPGG